MPAVAEVGPAPLYEFFINLLSAVYAWRYPIQLRRFSMTATLIMEMLSLAGVLFMVRFLFALFAEGKRSPRHLAVHRPFRPSRAGKNLLHFTATETGSAENDASSRNGLRIVAEGANPARRVG